VRNGEWRAAVKLRGGKDDARRLAGNLFPAQASLFGREKDDGRAEAVLIGLHGTRELNGRSAA